MLCIYTGLTAAKFGFGKFNLECFKFFIHDKEIVGGCWKAVRQRYIFHQRFCQGARWNKKAII
jgi:hypothetical protein